MRRMTIVLLATATTACGGGDGPTGTNNPPPASSVTVSMPGLTFSPFRARLALGGTVRFEFPTLSHNVIFSRSASGAPADIAETRNSTVTRAFPTAGLFRYDCTLHPGMVGEVEVGQ